MNGADKSTISALFLLKFDVHTGYTIEWSKTTSDSISLRGVEFKSLPSGLHDSARDVIAFVEDQDLENYPNKLLYGVSVFRSNADQAIKDRNDVKMYSLGILVSNEPEEMSKKPVSVVWKPLTFTSGWDFVEDLEKLLQLWLQEDHNEDFEKYKVLEDFFNSNKFVQIKDHVEQDSDKISTSSSTAKSASVHGLHHMLLSLPSMLENLGPLAFKVWKLALLRKKIIVHNASSIELSCSFVYCISLISTIPIEILSGLVGAGVDNINDLQYYQPLYNMGVNDINYLEQVIKKFDPGFIMSTTDEILLYKPVLYDYSVKLCAHDSSPEIVSSSNFAKSSALLKATQRDLRRFRLLYDEFDLYKDVDQEELNWWLDISEPTSWKEYIWKGFSWWATLGENDRSDCDFEANKEGLDNISTFNDQESIYTTTLQDTTVSQPRKTSIMGGSANLSSEISKEITDVLRIVGYFQSMTTKIFQVLIDIVNNSESDDSVEDSSILKDDDILYISLNDINEMGLDPYSLQDHEFVIDLVSVWWGRTAKVGSYVGNICC